MKLLLVILAVTFVSAQDERICCLAPGATTCTENIPASLCTKAGGSIIADATVDTSGTCCCYANDAGTSDRCLPDTPRSVCLGASVNGRCEAATSERCCCRPAGVVNDLLCVPRVPVALCTKTTGAECVVAPTPTPVCVCRIGGVDRELPTAVCTKFGGVCATTTVPTTCCCIYDGLVDIFGNPITPDPTDPGVLVRNECLPNTRISTCTESKKRSGVCYTGPVEGTTAAAEDRCSCQDPAVTGSVSALAGGPILRHVCEDKLGSTCIVDTCCCKYPSAPFEPCLADVQVPTCTAVGGALCVQSLVSAVATVETLASFPAATTCTAAADVDTSAIILRVTGTGTPTGTGAEQFSDTTIDTLGVAVPKFNLIQFAQQPTGDEKVYTRKLGGSVKFEVQPATDQLLIGGANLLGSLLQLPAQSEYTVTVVPATSIPNIFSGFIGSDNRRAVITPLAAAGSFRLSFSSGAPVFGLLGFSGPVSSVSVTFPTAIAGAAEITTSTSGVFATFKGGFAPTAGTMTANTVEGVTANPTAPSTVVAAVQQKASACVATFATVASFPTLPSPKAFVIPAGAAAIVRFNVGNGAEDSLLVHIADAGATPIIIAQNQPGGVVAGTFIASSGFTAATTITDRTLNVAAGESGTVQIFGVPTQIILEFDGTQAETSVSFSRNGLLTTEPAATATAITANNVYLTPASSFSE